MRSPIHLPFHTFEPIDLPLDLTLIPRKRTGRGNSRSILLHALGQADEFSNVALLCSSEPVAELVDFLLGKDLQKVLAQFIRQSQLWTRLAELLSVSALLCGQLVAAFHEVPGGLLRRNPLPFEWRRDDRSFRI